MGLPSRATIQWTGLLAGPAVGIAVALLLPDSYTAADGSTAVFSFAGQATAGLGIWMAIWWMTEAVSVYATALLPLAVLPAVRAVPITAVAAPYADPLIFLFMGGFIVALAVERWGLHRRIAFFSLRFVGTRPRNIIGGFMVITAGLSMWVSNTATAIMMMPIATSVIALIEKERGDPYSKDVQSFSVCLLLGIAYAASIGGIGTLIGTPPNLFLASYIRANLNHDISFASWMLVAMPIVLIFLPLTWFMLTRLIFPVVNEPIAGGRAFINSAYRQLGRFSRGEKLTLFVFSLTAAAWVTQPYLVKLTVGGAKPLAGLTDTGIGMIAAMVLFVLPVDARKGQFVMDWPTAAKLPWGLLLLFGGGLSLAAAVKTTGVGELLGAQAGALVGVPPLVLILLVVTVIIFLTELTSNTATTATLVPILASLAPTLKVDPMLLIVPAAIAASFAFMLPVATPPNAIVFGTDRITIPQMCKAGLWLNLAGIVLITALCYLLVLRVL